jgi:antitoxin (DNA-binding transcriptional repressor) of toxin-antitoxin stability system
MESLDKEQVEQPVQFDEFMTHAAAIFDEVAAGRQVVVQRDGQLVRLSPARKRAKRRPRHFSMDDPLWDIVGVGRSSGPTDVSSNKHKYLADAVADLHERGHS